MAVPNGVILQFFQWYNPADGTLWDDLKAKSVELHSSGFTAVWMPPAYKGSGGVNDVGYAVYDLFDLGEFNQKNTIRTKYGTRDQFLSAIKAAQIAGLQVYADVVFNHKDGADYTEDIWAQEMSWDDRNQAVSDWEVIKGWTGFNFPGRAGKYSTMEWHWWCFDALSYDQNHPEIGGRKLYRIKDKHFSTEVSHEHGNYDYLMADDLDMGESFVSGELQYWSEWFWQLTQVDGWRIDAVKHIRASYFPGWLGHLRQTFSREFFAVGEYWSPDVEDLHQFITTTGGSFSLFDVPLHYQFRAASISGNSFDMGTILDHTLVKDQPSLAVTFVDNHDTLPCQSLESWVEPWFKPLAYAIILLRREGYPCVFYADYYDQPGYLDKGRNVTLYSHRFLIDKFIAARRDYGFGDQQDYFDHPNTIGWIRLGDAAHPGAMAVVLTNGSDGSKWMNTYRPNTTFTDTTGHYAQKVNSDANGWAEFPCPAGSVSVWLQD